MKVSLAITMKEGLVVGMRSMPDNPCDGHTLAKTLEQAGILTDTDRPPATAIVERDITRALKAMIKRRSAIEPAIGHMKTDGRLGRNPLKGVLGDALHAVM